MLIHGKTSKGNMESVYAKDFNFENSAMLWNNIYQQRICRIKIPKLREFNYKLLHNIVPNGVTLSKFRDICSNCLYCNKKETTKHMLYECERIHQIWQNISILCNVSLSWKHIVCGFPKYSDTTKIAGLNYVFAIVIYAIFKENSYCKWNNKDYQRLPVKLRIKENLVYYRSILKHIDQNVAGHQLLENISNL